MTAFKVGGIALVGEFDGRWVIAHYVCADPGQGPFVQLYRCPIGWEVADGLGKCETLFSPLLIGIGQAVQTQRWAVLGKIPPGSFRQPKYLMDGLGTSWFLLDGKRERPLGADVPEKFRDLEVLAVWSAELIEERIRTGVNPFSYAARTTQRQRKLTEG